MCEAMLNLTVSCLESSFIWVDDAPWKPVRTASGSADGIVGAAASLTSFGVNVGCCMERWQWETFDPEAKLFLFQAKQTALCSKHSRG